MMHFLLLPLFFFSSYAYGSVSCQQNVPDLILTLAHEVERFSHTIETNLNNPEECRDTVLYLLMKEPRCKSVPAQQQLPAPLHTPHKPNLPPAPATRQRSATVPVLPPRSCSPTGKRQLPVAIKLDLLTGFPIFPK